MDITNLNPDSILQTAPLAEALSESGCPISKATLATMRSRGGGPPFRRWGRIPVYTWGEALKWAQDRLGEPRCSTSEEDAASATSTSIATPAHRPCPRSRPRRCRPLRLSEGRHGWRYVFCASQAADCRHWPGAVG